MKKNISINISGIIFHIEEDGYDTLKKYLDAINTYFSSYEDSEEIIADIEGRIAEIFLTKLTDGKQVVSAEDVSLLIKTMGNVADFEAIEEESDFEPVQAEQKEESGQKQQTRQEKRTEEKESSGTYKRPDKLYRDLKRQVLGGVASGIANYYNIDPIWVRVGLLLFVLSSGFIILAPLSGIVFIGYFIMWAVTPGSEDLVEDKKLKKLYRDPDNSVLGGVASGLSKYFDVDVMIVRILFIVFFFGFGTGFLAYIILWIITPEASTITDKMQMEGQPVTLSNIDSNIKKNKEEQSEEKDENAFTTVLLFPFRLIGRMFSGLSKAFGPLMLFLVGIIRVFTGSIISIVGLSVMFAMLVTAGVFLGLYNERDPWYFGDSDWGYFPYEIFQDTIPEIGVIFLLIAIFIPFLFVFIAGITVIAKRKVMSSSVGWSILGVWLIAIVGAAATLPNVIRDFREEGVYRDTEILSVQADTLVLDLDRRYDRDRFDRSFSSDDFDLIDLDLRASSDDQYRLDKRVYARGRTIRDAEENAQMIEYDLDIEGATLTFDSHYSFKPNSKFRAQELDMILYIPENVPFKVKRGMRDIMRYFSRRHDWWDIYRNTWMFTEDGLTCITCDEYRDDPNDNAGAFNKSQDLDDFDDIEIDDDFQVYITKGDSYEVEVEGEERIVRRVNTSVVGGELNIYADNDDFETDQIIINITAPSLSNLEVNDHAKVAIRGFDEYTINLRSYDNSSISLDGDINLLSLYMADESIISLTGSVNDLKATLIENSRLYALDATSESAEIETRAESRARINVTDYLKAEARGFSSIRYTGNPKLDVIGQGRSANISSY